MHTIRPLLEQRGGVRTRSNTEFMARCPVHDDNQASLSVKWAHDPDRGGRVLLYCHGCNAAVDDITAALADDALPVGEEHGLPLIRFPLEATADAHAAVENGAVGKVLVDVAG